MPRFRSHDDSVFFRVPSVATQFSPFTLLQSHQQIAGFDLRPRLDQKLGDLAGFLGVQSGFHLHGFQDAKFLAGGYVFSRRGRDAHDQARHGGGHMMEIARLGFGTGLRLTAQ